jgi:hypothetical protein
VNREALIEAMARAIALADDEDYMEDYRRYDKRAAGALSAIENLGAVVVPVEASENANDSVAKVIHDTDDMADSTWPESETDDGYRGGGGFARVCRWPELYRNAARNARAAMIAASPYRKKAAED